MIRITTDPTYHLNPDEILVYGSNRAGRNGKGAALTAHRRFGAAMGVGKGRTGQCYALPTKGFYLEVLPLKEIKVEVDDLKVYVIEHPELTFKITAVGTGLAGYSIEQIAPLFIDFINLQNVHFPIEFWDFFNNQKQQ